MKDAGHETPEETLARAGVREVPIGPGRARANGAAVRSIDDARETSGAWDPRSGDGEHMNGGA